MGIHRPFSRPMFTLQGSVLTSGGAKNLAKGQFTIVNSKVASANGAVVVEDFSALPKDAKLELRLGVNKIDGVRTNSTPSTMASETFGLNDVKDIKATYPKQFEQKFDDLIVGFDGINDSAALNLSEGETTVLDVTVSGDHVGFITGYCDYTFRIHFGKEAGETDQEVIQRAAEVLKNQKFPQGPSINEVIDIKVVDSEAPALAGTSYTFRSLTLTDSGDSNALSLVQAQYPNYKVTRTDRNGLKSVYGILSLTSDTIPAFSSTNALLQKGCADCPAGYTEIPGGFVYSVTLEDDGEDLSADVEALEGAVADSAVKLGQETESAGVGLYKVVLEAELAEADLATFLEANPTGQVTLVGEVAAVCENDTAVTVAWVAGQVCKASTAEYRIQLEDADCDGDTLVKLQAAYPNLVISVAQGGSPAADIAGGCQKVYKTTVVTDIVCDECDDIFVQAFKSEAPADYDFHSWTKVEATPNANSKMGIRLTGKPFIMTPVEATRDSIPFYETSTEIKVAGGYIEEVNSSFDKQYVDCSAPFTPIDLFKVTRLSRKQDRDGLGYHLLQWEDASRYYFTGTHRHPNNLFAKQFLGEESVLDFKKQYVSYHILIHDSKYSQGVGRTSDMGTEYIVVAEFGKHQAVEAYINKLAAASGNSAVGVTA